MLEVKNVKVLPFNIEFMEIVWEISNTSEDILDYDFYVLRSEAEEGPFDTIAGPLVDVYRVRDSSVHAITTHRIYYYKIKTRNRVTGEEKEFGPFDIEGIPNLIAVEMIRRETAVLLPEFAGTKFWLFPRKTFGQRCPNCYDEVLQKKLSERCTTCWGTTYSGGYHYPTEFWGQMDMPQQQEQVSLEDHKQPKMARLRLGPSPGVKPMDLIIDYKNFRYKVVNVSGTSLNGVAVRQDLQIVMLEKGCVEDKIPLKLPNTDFVPKRNFENAQSTETFTLGVLKNYGF